MRQKKFGQSPPVSELATNLQPSRKYEDETAGFFRGLGCSVEVRVQVHGARATHKIDVLVGFTRFGIETKWVIECKFWKRNVPKEKVLALKAVVEDVGAERGILVSAVGFQPGAVRAAEHTNVTLSGLRELKERAREDLMLSALHALETETIKLQDSLSNLYVYENKAPLSFISKPLPGVNGPDVFNAMGKLGLLKGLLERARISHPPFLVDIDESGASFAMTIDQLVERATLIIAGARETLGRNKARCDENTAST